MNARDLQLAIPGSYVPHMPIIRIARVKSTLTVFSTKQRPRKVTMRGGCWYWPEPQCSLCRRRLGSVVDEQDGGVLYLNNEVMRWLIYLTSLLKVRLRHVRAITRNSFGCCRDLSFYICEPLLFRLLCFARLEHVLYPPPPPPLHPQAVTGATTRSW